MGKKNYLNATKNTKQVEQNALYGYKMPTPLEYKMPVDFARNILRQHKNASTVGSQQEILCDYVNSQYDLKGTCVRVVTY
jgi:Txe/YoeB family toxin of Txe-Axe toxin-antitoxin module